MTRRAFLGLPILGMAVPAVGAPVVSDGFIVSGELQAENSPGYYSLNGADAVSLMLSEELAPSMARAADALVGTQVEFVLRRRVHP